MYEKGEKSMNELNCKVCENPTKCSEDAVAITCSLCIMAILLEKSCCESNEIGIA